MNTTAATLYAPAFGLAGDRYTKDEMTSAYKKYAVTDHPDHGGDATLFTLRTAAFNQMKLVFAKKRGMGVNKGDKLWLEQFVTAMTPINEFSAAEEKFYQKMYEKPYENPNVVTWKMVKPVRLSDESREDYNRRYARAYAAWRYAYDPNYAAARRASSRACHQRHSASYSK